MANAEHRATGGNQRGRAKVELLRAENRRHHDVTAGLQPAIGPQYDARPQIVQHQRLVCFRDANFERAAGVFYGTERRSARAAVMAADQNHVRIRLRDAGGNRPDSRLRDEFHIDFRP